METIVKGLIENKLEDIKQELTEFTANLVYECETMEKRKDVDHSLGDNPYDYSGEIVKIENDISVRDLAEFKNNEYYFGESDLELFLSKFYTGNRSASYVSGHGWNYESYWNVLNNRIDELVDKIIEETIDFLVTSHRAGLIEFLDNEYESFSSNDENDVSIEGITDYLNEYFIELFIGEMALDMVEEVGLLKLYSIGQSHHLTVT